MSEYLGVSNKAFNNSFPRYSLNSIQSHFWATETEQKQPQCLLMDLLLPDSATRCHPQIIQVYAVPSC